MDVWADGSETKSLVGFGSDGILCAVALRDWTHWRLRATRRRGHGRRQMPAVAAGGKFHGGGQEEPSVMMI
jgi:hypothetical protein